MTLQAENLGTVIDPQPEQGALETERLSEAVRGASALFVCDASSAALEVLKSLAVGISLPEAVKIFSPAPRKIESAVPQLKSRVTTLPPPVTTDSSESAFAPELSARGMKVFIGTARPDPLFGLVDAKVEACLNWIAHSHREAARTRKEMEPSPFEQTRPKEAIDGLADGIKEASFFDILPRGGRAKSVLENAPFDAIKNGFLTIGLQPAKAMVIGTGGKGYDDNLSSAVRIAWNVLPGARKSGSIVLMAECSEGLGSTALDMAATGRIPREPTGKKGSYLEGLEDLYYLSKMREEYDVLLLSGLPEVYAKTKLGLATAKGSGEAVGRLLNKLGKTGKMNVVTRASECRIEST